MSALLYLNAPQRRFVRFFLGGPPARAVWKTAAGRVIGPVVDLFNPPADAVSVSVNRHGDGEFEVRGLKVAETSISLRDLAALAPCWDEPLRTLNDLGRQIAEAPDPGPGVPVSGKVHPDLGRRFEATAKAEGRTPGEVIADLVLRYVEGRL